MDNLFDRLYALEPDRDQFDVERPRMVRLTPEAKRVWIRFADDHALAGTALVGDEAASWAKLEGYAARFALVFHLVRVASDDPSIADPDVVDLASVEMAIALVRWFCREVDRVYAILRGGEDDRDRRRLEEWISARHNGVASVRDLTHGLRVFKGDREKAKAALDDLVASGRGDWEHDGGRPGRPSARVRLRGAPVPETPAQPPATLGFGDGDGP